jgi:2-C-methyl-D-erythritol 4-phosphate cytidylyltransferase
MNVTAIIVAAGLGKRMGEATPKQFIHLLGKPLLAHTLIPFTSVQDIKQIIVLVPKDWQEYCQETVIEKYGFIKVSKLIQGGQERQDSVYLGLQHVDTDVDVVLIHDGVRPLISKSLIEDSVKTAGVSGAAVVAIPSSDTLKEVSSEGLIKGTLSREGLWLAQTPQAFQKKILLEAYETASKDHFYSTDDAALVERIGYPIKVIRGSSTNIKITTPEDLRYAEFVLKER